MASASQREKQRNQGGLTGTKAGGDFICGGNAGDEEKLKKKERESDGRCAGRGVTEAPNEGERKQVEREKKKKF